VDTLGLDNLLLVLKTEEDFSSTLLLFLLQDLQFVVLLSVPLVKLVMVTIIVLLVFVILLVLDSFILTLLVAVSPTLTAQLLALNVTQILILVN
jgi:hypothetical protein